MPEEREACVLEESIEGDRHVRQRKATPRDKAAGGVTPGCMWEHSVGQRSAYEEPPRGMQRVNGSQDTRGGTYEGIQNGRSKHTTPHSESRGRART